ncbi:MAG: hypothetical protein AB7I24_10170 [Candidatus Nanopelagicales bacterium]
MTGTHVDVEEQAKVTQWRWLLVGLGALALVAATTLLWTSGWSVHWSTCTDVADSIELLDCTTTRWNAPAVIGSVLLFALAAALVVVGRRRTRRA